MLPNRLIIKHNSSLDASLVPHRIQGLTELFKLECLVNNASHVHLPALQVLDTAADTPHLRKGSNDRNLITKHLGRRHLDQSLLLINAIVDELATPRTKINRLLQHSRTPRSLDNNIKAIRILLLERRPLLARILTVELDVLVSAVELLGKVHLGALVGCDDGVLAAVVLEQLRQTQTCGTGADEKDAGADVRAYAVHAVDGAGSGFEEGRFFPGEVREWEELFGGEGAVLGESSVHWLRVILVESGD